MYFYKQFRQQPTHRNPVPRSPEGDLGVSVHPLYSGRRLLRVRDDAAQVDHAPHVDKHVGATGDERRRLWNSDNDADAVNETVKIE